MKRMARFAAASVLLLGVLGAGSTATAAPATAPSTSTSAPAAAASSAAAAYSCTGKFCIYNGWDGRGSSCQWAGNKANTADGCPFIRRGGVVRSVWNGTGSKVTYYRQTNYHGRIGSTPAGRGGNLQGDYLIRSFKH